MTRCWITTGHKKPQVSDQCLYREICQVDRFIKKKKETHQLLKKELLPWVNLEILNNYLSCNL